MEFECVMSHIGWGGEQTLFIRVWKPSSRRRVLKPWGEARRGVDCDVEEQTTIYKDVETFP